MRQLIFITAVLNEKASKESFFPLLTKQTQSIVVRKVDFIQILSYNPPT